MDTEEDLEMVSEVHACIVMDAECGVINSQTTSKDRAGRISVCMHELRAHPLLHGSESQ